jgi:hypothetical protein
MLQEVLQGSASLLGPISKLSTERKGLKDTALRAISTALDETYLYYRDLENTDGRNLDREAQIERYWSAAAIQIRHFNNDLAKICDRKSEYWINPDKFDRRRINELNIALDDVREAYRKML